MQIQLTGPQLSSGGTDMDLVESRRFVTGVWANPGEEITFSFPESMIGENISVQIGFHTNELNQGLQEGTTEQGKKQYFKFKRFPLNLDITQKITRQVSTVRDGTATIKLSNGFGGVVSFVAGAGFDPRDRWVGVAGGQLMPVYELGAIGQASWDEQMAKYPAPWMQLRSDNISILIPTHHFLVPGRRVLKWPVAATSYWHNVIRASDQFTAFGALRRGPDEFIFDPAIPIGAEAYQFFDQAVFPLDEAARIANPPGDFRTAFHEIGHLRQMASWQFLGGTAEVTNMIVAAYLSETFSRMKLHNTINAAPLERDASVGEIYRDQLELTSVIEQMDKLIKLDLKDRQKKWDYFEERTDYSTSFRHAKVMAFGMVAKTFGWDVYKDTFAAYNDQDLHTHRTRQEQLDIFVRELSRAADHDLSDFFELWGANLSDKAKDTIAEIPGIEHWAPTKGDPDVSPKLELNVSDYPDNSDGSYYQIRNFRFFSNQGQQKNNVIWTNRKSRDVSFYLESNPTCIDCDAPFPLTVGLRGKSTTGAYVFEKSFEDPVYNTQTQSFFHPKVVTLTIPKGRGVYEVCFLRVPKSLTGLTALETAKEFKFEGINRSTKCITGGIIIAQQ